MPPIHDPYPYGLRWQDLQPDPASLRNVEAPAFWHRLHDGLELLTHPHHGTPEQTERVLDAALALAGRMVTLKQFDDWSRGKIMAVALDTAIIWERR